MSGLITVFRALFAEEGPTDRVMQSAKRFEDIEPFALPETEMRFLLTCGHERDLAGLREEIAQLADTDAFRLEALFARPLDHDEFHGALRFGRALDQLSVPLLHDIGYMISDRLDIAACSPDLGFLSDAGHHQNAFGLASKARTRSDEELRPEALIKAMPPEDADLDVTASAESDPDGLKKAAVKSRPAKIRSAGLNTTGRPGALARGIDAARLSGAKTISLGMAAPPARPVSAAVRRAISQGCRIDAADHKASLDMPGGELAAKVAALTGEAQRFSIFDWEKFAGELALIADFAEHRNEFPGQPNLSDMASSRLVEQIRTSGDLGLARLLKL